MRMSLVHTQSLSLATASCLYYAIFLTIAGEPATALKCYTGMQHASTPLPEALNLHECPAFMQDPSCSRVVNPKTASAMYACHIPKCTVSNYLMLLSTTLSPPVPQCSEREWRSSGVRGVSPTPARRAHGVLLQHRRVQQAPCRDQCGGP